MTIEEIPAEFAAVAAGESDTVYEQLFGFADRSRWDADLPWLAAALLSRAADAAVTDDAGRAALDEVRAYRTSLDAAVERASRHGVVLLEPTNIRAGHHGYAWGAPLVSSPISARLGAELAARLAWSEDDQIAERWYGSDDRQYPGFWRDGEFPAPLSWLIARAPEAALGRAHLAAHGPGRGVVMKDLTPARPLSWQLHLGVEEGYEIVSMPPGTGLFLGVNEPERSGEKDRIIAHAMEVLWRDLELARPARHALRLDEPVGGIETPAALTEGLQALVSRLLSRENPWSSVGDFLAHLLAEGVNVVDVAATGWTAAGTFFPGNSLAQIYRPAPGERIVIRERMPHALFGWTASQGEGAVAWVREFKATSTGPRHAAIPSASQTWSLSDVLLGSWPRRGKVTRAGVEEAIMVLQEAGTWRRIAPAEIAGVAGEPVEVAPGVVFTRVHAERQFAALRVSLDEDARTLYRRNGMATALVVTNGVVRVREARSGAVLVESLGLAEPWTGEPGHTDEAFVFADRGDLIIEAVDGPAEFYDAHRPVPGVSLPECARS